MPSITSFVQRIFIDAGSAAACVFIGPTIANVEILRVERTAGDPPHTGAFKSSMLDALGQALSSRREVVVDFDANTRIYAVRLR